MFDIDTTIVLSAGSVEYGIEDAAIDIDDLIRALQDAKNDGMTHVVQSSGNYRGAQWQRVSADWSYANEEL